MLDVTQVDVERRHDHGQRRGKEVEGREGDGQDPHVPPRRLVSDDQQDQRQDAELDAEVDDRRAHVRQRQDLPGKRDLLHQSGAVDDDARRGIDGRLEHVPDHQTGEEVDEEAGNAVLQENRKDQKVDPQRHGRREHGPEDSQHRALVLDADVRGDQAGQQLSSRREIAKPRQQRGSRTHDAHGGVLDRAPRGPRRRGATH